MLTVKLPNKMETYIQVKERKRVRDLYAYICEKKGLTPSAYKLSYSCKIEKEDDMDKTVAELDIWCVTLENVVGECVMHTCTHACTFIEATQTICHAYRYYMHVRTYSCLTCMNQTNSTKMLHRTFRILRC